MRSLRLAGVERAVSRLAFGLGSAGSPGSAPTGDLLDAFVAGGGTLVDTAHVYGDGTSDLALGKWLAGRDREDVHILGKGCHPMVHGTPRVTPEVMHAELTESLDRIGTDYLDIYLLHRDDPTAAVGPIVEALNEEHAAGRIRTFGGSNWSVERIDAANTYAAGRGLVPFMVNSPGWSLGVPNEDMWPDCVYVDDDVRAWHTANQMPLIAWSAQASGFFSGRYSPGHNTSADVARVYYNDENFARLSRAQALAQRRGMASNEIALAYVLHQHCPTVALFSARTLEQLHKTLSAADLELSADETRFLEYGEGSP